MRKHKSGFIGLSLFMLGIIASQISTPSLANAQAASNDPCVAEDHQSQPSNEESTPAASVTLNELLPNPVGKDADGEYIELKNAGSNAADLSGWSLVTASGKTYELSLEIPANSTVALPYQDTRLTLPNSAGSITLRNSSGAEVETVAYESSKEGESWAKNDANAWNWTGQPTPGAANSFPAPTEAPASTETTSPSGGSSGTSTDVEVQPAMTEIAAAKDLNPGTETTVSGTVTIAPGTLGKRTFAMQDSTGGVVAQVYGSVLPELKSGDMLTVTGKVTQKGEVIIIGTNASKMSIDGANAVTASHLQLADISSSHDGVYGMLSAIVTKVSKKTVTVADDTLSREITIKLSTESAVSEGDQIAASGVIRWKNGSPELFMGTNDAIAVIEAAPQSESSPTESSDTEESVESAPTGVATAAAACSTLAALLAGKKK